MTDNQGAQARLRESLGTAFPGAALPGVEGLLGADVPYLSAAMEETPRLASTATRVNRIATADTEILGRSIPAGNVFCLVLVLK